MSNLEIKNLPEKYQPLWQRCAPLLQKGRPDDEGHAKDTVEFILNYKGALKFDPEVIIPVAMMHDIGHSALLPEHLKYVSGGVKIANGKLVHMLAGAKVAYDLLTGFKYNPVKTKEIVDIISIHDWDQLEVADAKAVYDADNKMFFHDIDALDRFNQERLEKYRHSYEPEILQDLIKKQLDVFFHPEFKKIAEERFKSLKI
ncbi:MAG: hypothetical protein NTX82_03055 [Candidatus Parcubacteria bacterium]|nr:hypothetical protein [Candidatus Parcubacteria bacterium]